MSSAFAFTSTRSAPATAAPNSQATLTYTIIPGDTPNYMTLLEETLIGDCTLGASGKKIISSIMSPDTTKTISITMGASGTCTIHGNYTTTQEVNYPDSVITITATPVACTNGQTQACTISGCAGTKTCVNNNWGSCVKTNSSCGTGTGGTSKSCGFLMYDDGGECKYNTLILMAVIFMFFVLLIKIAGGGK